jgi:2-C-methyl-D-erythritol 4-phosphate cytidylyltransferase/2-C-methyl-D-erythritol 4-phosphate cytidylyltransferase/2-C-methyl-D-erythritol 2,4-cyclodiphosphate synthase
MNRATALVLAAGQSQRLGGDTPKPYLPIAGRPLVLRTLDRMFSAASVAQVVLVVAADQVSRCERMLRSDPALKGRPWLLEAGGATRQQSARRGLARVDANADIVIIHDCARPFVSAGLIDRCVEAAAEKQAVVVGLPVRDTIKAVSQDGWIQTTPERSALWEIQTPQVFERELIVSAHERAEREGAVVTDDAMVVERIGRPVYVLEGERTNFKITVAEDVWLAEILIREGRVP